MSEFSKILKILKMIFVFETFGILPVNIIDHFIGVKQQVTFIYPILIHLISFIYWNITMELNECFQWIRLIIY